MVAALAAAPPRPSSSPSPLLGAPHHQQQQQLFCCFAVHSSNTRSRSSSMLTTFTPSAATVVASVPQRHHLCLGSLRTRHNVTVPTWTTSRASSIDQTQRAPYSTRVRPGVCCNASTGRLDLDALAELDRVVRHATPLSAGTSPGQRVKLGETSHHPVHIPATAVRTAPPTWSLECQPVSAGRHGALTHRRSRADTRDLIGGINRE